MMYLKHSLVAAAALIAGLAHTVAGASAAPLSSALSHPGKSDVQRVGWGWGYRYYDGPYDYRPYYYRPYYYQYPRYYYPGPSYYAPPPRPYGAVEYCLSRFRSYDPRTGTYLGYDGYRHPCP